MARVSVLMTIYNAGPFLKESIDSLIAQTFLDWELIAVENGSKDNSPAILASYKDSRIRVVSLKDNIGRIGGLRYAFDQAKSQYIAILDADDVASPLRFERQVEILDQHSDTVLVGSWAQHIDENSRVFNTWQPPTQIKDIHECLSWIDPIVHSSAMYRRDAAVSVGGYPKEYIYAHDFAMILELARIGKLEIIGEYLCKLRVFSGNMSNSSMHAMDVASEGLKLIKYAGEVLPLSEAAKRMNRCSIAKYEIRCGRALMRSKKTFAGIKMILKALAQHPEVLWVNGFVRNRFYA